MIKSIFKRNRASNQNINFRMVLCVALAFIMLVLPVSVRASDLYYYNKYNVVEKTEARISLSTRPSTGYIIDSSHYVSSSYTVKYNGDGTPYMEQVNPTRVGASELLSGSQSYGYKYKNMWIDVGTDRRYLGQIEGGYGYGTDRLTVAIYRVDLESVGKERGNLINSNIIGTYYQYPSNGIHTDGYWYVRTGIVNNAPTIPSSIIVPELKSNKLASISWGTSTDLDGDNITYFLERSVNGGSYTPIYNGGSKSYTDSPQVSWNTVTYRVRAYDGKEYSGYRTSLAVMVIHNQPPTIPSSITVPTLKSYLTTTISWGNSTDTDGDSITYFLERSVNGASYIQIYSNSSTNYIESPQASWNTVTYRVRAYDGKDYSGYRTSANMTVFHNNLPTVTTGISGGIVSNENLYFGKELGTNSILLQGTVKDVDVGDKNTIKYTLNNGSDLPSYTNIVIADNINANGNNIDFSNSITIDDNIPEGSYQLKVWAEDDKGGKSTVITHNFIVDKTGPQITMVKAEAESSSSIRVEVYASDPVIYNTSKAGVGLHDTETYIFNKDGVDIDSGRTNNILNDTVLEPNRQYTYKVKAKDKLNNIGSYSDINKLYTLALNPIKVILKEITDVTLKFEVVNTNSNANVPETIIELKEKGKSTVVSSSGWSANSNKLLTGLTPGKEYEAYINTRNGDNKDNGWLTVPGDIPLEDEYGNPVTVITTVVPVSNFRVSGSSINTITATWDKTEGQEYQVFLKDEFNNEVDGSRSSWLKDNSYTFTELPLANTKYVPYITTRRENNSFSLNSVKVNNEEKAYTDAESVSKGTFISGEDFIEVKLVVDSSKNPNDTQYEIKNDTTTQAATVFHSNPAWINTDLARESYYTYSVRVINKNGKLSNFAKLIFINGEEAHTYIPDLEISDDIIDKPVEAINLDDLKIWDPSNPVWFNPEELNGKAAILDGETFIVTRNRVETVKNKDVVEVKNYTFSDSGYGYADWKELNEGLFEEKIMFNTPGYYKTHTKFKNYSRESNPVIVNYLVDWIKPTFTVEKVIKNQTVVTGNSFEVRISAEDNMSKYLFYSIDGGKNYFLLKDNNTIATFTDIKKSIAGIQNKLTVRLCDINGNVVEEVLTIWGIAK